MISFCPVEELSSIYTTHVTTLEHVAVLLSNGCGGTCAKNSSLLDENLSDVF